VLPKERPSAEFALEFIRLSLVESSPVETFDINYQSGHWTALSELSELYSIHGRDPTFSFNLPLTDQFD
jgi:hypothetical protein